MMNLDFEEGTWRQTASGEQYSEVSGPEGWTMWWVEGPGTNPPTVVEEAHKEARAVRAAESMQRNKAPFPASVLQKFLYSLSINTTNFYRPEMKVIEKVPPFLDPLRINTGKKAAQFFGFYKRVKAGYFQRANVEPGSTVTFSAWGMAWYSMKDDPHYSQWVDGTGAVHTIHDGGDGFTLSVGIDPTGGVDPLSASVVWKNENYYDGFGEIQVTVPNCGERITLFLKGEADNPFKHCDAYMDTAVVAVNSDSTCVCPHVDYEKTFHLLPYSASLEQMKHVSSIAFPAKGTMGFCKEDAGSGPTTRNIISYWFSNGSWQAGELEAFFSQNYPGANLSRVNLYASTPPTPEPDPGDPPAAIDHPSNNMVGLHMGEARKDWDKYYTEALPGVAKCFSLGFALEAKRVSAPGTLIVWRKFQDHIGDDPSNAQQLVDFYLAEVDTAARNMGLSRAQLLDRMEGIVIESHNEKIPSKNAPAINQAVEFDRRFCNYTTDTFGGKLRPGVLTAAIGNPHETEVELLLPAVEAAIQNNGLVAPHSYWTSNRTDDGQWLATKWKHHAGRWTEWDKVFVNHGLYPQYYLGEGGVVYSNDGDDFVSGQGWRACGDILKYLQQIGYFNQRVIEWNREHGGRCFGLTLFHYGNWGWDNFALGHGDMLLLKNHQWEG